MLNRIFVTATLTLLVGCQTTSSPEATKPTWDRAYMHALNVGGNQFCGYPMVSEATQTCMVNFSAEARKRGRKFPVVVFLHGCFRFNPRYGRWLADLGYIVFSPDSFQRQGGGYLLLARLCPPYIQEETFRTSSLTSQFVEASWTLADARRFGLHGGQASKKP